MRVLVADDDPVSRTIVAAVSEKLGCQVEAAEDGLQAWAAMTRPDPPPLALLDWVMPGLEGPEICRRLRALGGEAPPYLVVLSARDRKEDVVAGLEAGANDYLTKPIDPTELRARIRVGQRTLELQRRLAGTVGELTEALRQIRALRGVVPICMHCKSVRDDRGYWERVEAYVARYAGVRFSHSLCPECLERFYPEQARAPIPEIADAAPGGDARLALRKTILVVDDDEAIVRVCRRLLKSLGYEVLTAGGGREAVELLRAQGGRVALVILDVVMPGMDGVETFHALRAIAPSVKVLLSTGHGVESETAELLERGAAGLILKPFDVAALSARLQELL